jgi:predicted metalloprotease with PDZ domain
MKQLLHITTALLISHCLFAQQSKSNIKYTVDLTRVENDRVLVEMANIKVSTPEAVFHMPKMIPGTYRVADYGRYISNVKAFDKKGKELVVVKTDTNTWKINSAQKLIKITYLVDDILDTPKQGPEIYPMAATNIEVGKNFVINTSGFFGYLENSKDVPMNFDIIRPKEFYGSTGLIALETSAQLPKIKNEINPVNDDKRVDRYYVENYDRLIDSPLMYAKPDTAIVKVANAEVLIASYSPNGKVTAKEIASTVSEVLRAQASYLGGKLPVEKYAFLFYFVDIPLISYGALEHSYSSFYYMPETTIDQMNQQLRDFAAHEFFHIVTPLNIHSEEIHQFGFNDPKMSKHLWMYEGVTEYFAGNVQVKYGLITPEQYLRVLSSKMNAADNFINDVPFTDISLQMLGQYSKQFANVYQKGALIAMCLDIKLRELSSGKYGMQNLMGDLSKRYGKNSAFKDDQLFSEIEAMTYPEIGTFLRKYVGGSQLLPFSEIMNLAGISHTGGEMTKELSLGFTSQAIGVVEFEGKKKLNIANMAGLTDQGRKLDLRQGDILIEINQEIVPDIGPEISNFFTKHKANLKEGENLTLTVLRENETGEKKKINLTAKVEKCETKQKHALTFMKEATDKQLQIRKSWLTAN